MAVRAAGERAFVSDRGVDPAPRRDARILLVGNYPPDGQHSMLRYADWLFARLAENGYAVELIRPPIVFGRLAGGNASARKWLGYIDKLLLFPFRIMWRARKCDLVHLCDHSNGIYVWFTGTIPVLVTCHDLIGIRAALGEFEGETVRLTGRLLQRLTLSSLKRVRYFCCVSQTTRSDLARLVEDIGREIRCIDNALIGYAPMERDDAERVIRQAMLPCDGRYFLHVGGDIWYKNRSGVIRLFAELRSKPRFQKFMLVLAGQALSPGSRSLIAELGLGESIRTVTNPSSVLLQALYSRAEALLFISLQEGFGWPIIEAHACGCAVVTSDREPMKGIGGSAALVIDPVRVAEGAARIDAAWDELRSRRSQNLANAARFGEGDIFRKYRKYYDDILASRTKRLSGAPERRMLVKPLSAADGGSLVVDHRRIATRAESQ